MKGYTRDDVGTITSRTDLLELHINLIVLTRLLIKYDFPEHAVPDTTMRNSL